MSDADLIEAGPTPPPRAGLRQWAALVTLVLPVLVVSIDNTALSFAVPALSTELQPSSQQLLWIVDVYGLVLAGLLVTMGMLGDRVGRRRLLMIGAAGFGLVSVYAAFAPDAGHLIAARVLLAVFGATLMPSTLSLLRNLFLDDGQRRLALAIWATGFSGGSAIGPILGGWLLEHFWWGAIFLVSVPAAVILLVAGPFLLPESRNPDAGRLDVPSVLLSIGAMLPLVFAIKQGAEAGLDVPTVASFLVGAGLGAVFLRRQLTRPDPLLDLRLFTRSAFTASVAANFFSIFAFAALMFFMTQHLQFVEGRSPMQAAIVLIPGAVASIVAGLLAVALARAFAIPNVIGVGLLLAFAGYCLGVTLTTDSSLGVVVGVFVLVGTGAGLAETLTNDVILASVPAQRAGAASGISETAYELGSALGVAILGSLLTSVYRSHIVVPEGVPAFARPAIENMIGTAMPAADQLPEPLAEAVRAAARTAFESGVATTCLVGAVVMGLTAVVTWTILRRSDAPSAV
ncbi:MFS transporter [Mobilicoccus pelagius]|uniref:Putative drug resistance transporter n=1 Tax=Mobilicoccus pelagius NBRC 104925 TaxID=1089455 RepID=H5UPQ1_9MICO|nr:MFS transporter [Mobilicoccus pelagius]GAB47709.1 putative drug resistance transporter [Mobilicoccus pelagius NBRC 104925]